MLELCSNCECCNVDLPPGSEMARICSFECTFCRNCADQMLGGRCQIAAESGFAGPSARRQNW
jgi:hypothetical protein